MVLHAFGTSRIDYCNGLLHGLPDCEIAKLQRGQNAAARLLMSCKMYDHIITPILTNLHWLPVRYRINCKILLLTFKALYGMAPSYIIDLIHTKTNTRNLLRSNEGVLLKHPSGKMKKSFGDRSFSVAAPTHGTLFLLDSAASNVFLLLSLILKLIFLNWLLISLRY